MYNSLSTFYQIEFKETFECRGLHNVEINRLATVCCWISCLQMHVPDVTIMKENNGFLQFESRINIHEYVYMLSLLVFF